jgi:starch synthase (maltosyl-transferring)
VPRRSSASSIPPSELARRPLLAAAAPRVVIDEIRPSVDDGRFPIKRIVGEPVRVSARLYADGHDRSTGALLFRRAGTRDWTETPLAALGDDRFEAVFHCDAPGEYEYAIAAWIDAFAGFRDALAKKRAAGRDLASELGDGAVLARAAAARARGEDARWLADAARRLDDASHGEERVDLALSSELASRMAAWPDRRREARSRPLRALVERERAAVGAWYELFPRSCSATAGRHGTLRDCEERLAYVAQMGFDVVYLPPIHPIGRSRRKGPNNRPAASPGDPGSPWAIGAREGGHDAVHSELGTLADFDRLVERARTLGLEIALDLAFQCSPDHPWVARHPEWFRHRPDGAIRHAENPPKQYQDVYPLEFEGEHAASLWEELRSIVRFWIARGVRIFRVDNPHTKPFAFWEWLIREIRAEHPDVVFLAEAFARPVVMKRLAKLGFSQSYTYFTWRNTKRELVDYLSELKGSEVREYLRPNLFANTPDILHEYLQTGGRPAFQIRLVLAATLCGSYGIYGPPFELCVGDAVPGTEEYADSEKYQVRHWDLSTPGSLRDLVARVNALRRESAALRTGALEFLPIDNEELVAYARIAPAAREVIVAVVNLNPRLAHAGWLELPLERLGLDPERPYQMEDLLGGTHWLWQGPRNYVQLDPHALPAHLFRVRRGVRTEREFDYWL